MISFNIIDTVKVKFSRHNLKGFLKDIILSEDRILGDLNFILCDDAYLLEINLKYLNHDYFTDVITFDYCEGSVINGDIFISIDQVKENARLMNVSFICEFHRIVFHGLLHLCAYKDKTKSDKLVMTNKEDFYLNKFDLFKK